MKSFKFKNGTYTGQAKLKNLPHGKGKLDVKKIINKRTYSIVKTKFYSGNWVKGKMHGKGELRIGELDAIDHLEIYSGNWKNNFLEGRGKYLQYINGNLETKYLGHFEKNKRNGKGIVFNMHYSKIDPQLNKCIGNWKNGSLEGEATYIDPLFEHQDCVVVEKLFKKLKGNKKIEKKLGMTSAEDLYDLNVYLNKHGTIKGFEPNNGEKGEIYAEGKGVFKSGMRAGLHINKIFYFKSKNKRKLIATFKGFWNKNLDVVKKNLVIHD